MGGIRRRSSSTPLRISLWFAYLLADSTAIYTLGHLSMASESGEHRLAAFWAPFLLLHLGGPDNITAYALEDNRLWLRHLQTLGVQVLGAAYVLYRYTAGTGTGTLLLRLASVSMFVAGLVKYAERTWALKRGNMSSLGKSDDWVDPFQLLRPGMGDEETLVRAHAQLAMCRCVFSDTTPSGSRNPKTTDPAYYYSPRLRPYYDEDIFKLLEMELSLTYDMLYTKAAVIHTWYGFCIHFVSLVGTATAFLLFQLSATSSTSGYNKVDVAISYFLLGGALALEVISACRAVFSSWTCFFILSKSKDYSWTSDAWLEWLHCSVLSPLRKPFKPASRRLWRGTMGQYNLFHLCTRERTDLGSRMAVKLGLEELWDKIHFSGTFSGNDSLSMQQFKELLLTTIQRESFARCTYTITTLDTRGRFILDRKNAFDSFAKWSVVDIEFHESILMWHFATDLFIWESKAAHDPKLLEATRVLSNYMVFLLVAKPGMLPGRARDTLSLKSISTLKKMCENFLRDEDNSTLRVSANPRTSFWNNCSAFKQLFLHEGPYSSSITQAQREKVAGVLLCNTKVANNQWANQTGPESLAASRDDMSRCAAWLAKQLLDMDTPSTLELIFAVWVELMIYAAEQCPRDSHVRELCKGGEFITIVWLLIHHWMHTHRHKIA
ncbi:hypothetical protein BS78_09G044200 [Paspalum vaginatum]|nr:hypothetical protein BS78_09G044200 [Paspalum vaginatum]